MCSNVSLIALLHSTITAGQFDQTENSGPHQFDFEIIKDATSNFSRDNELGTGGFGAVY